MALGNTEKNTDNNTDNNTSKIDNINRIKNNIYSRVINHLNEKASKSFNILLKKQSPV